LIIENTQANEIAQIIDLNGRTVQTFPTQSLITNQPITNLSDGVYCLKIGNNTQKIIIQR